MASEISDEMLAAWGSYGRGVTLDSRPLSATNGFGSDVVMLWNVFGALEEKVRNLSE